MSLIFHRCFNGRSISVVIVYTLTIGVTICYLKFSPPKIYYVPPPQISDGIERLDRVFILLFFQKCSKKINVFVNSQYFNQLFYHFSHCSGRRVLKEKDQVDSTQTDKKTKTKPVTKGASYHKIQYLTTQEFDGVPK